MKEATQTGEGVVPEREKREERHEMRDDSIKMTLIEEKKKKNKTDATNGLLHGIKCSMPTCSVPDSRTSTAGQPQTTTTPLPRSHV